MKNKSKNPLPPSPSPDPLPVGAQVWVSTLKALGQVAEGPNRKGELRIVVGALSLWLAPSALAPVKSQGNPKGQKAGQAPRSMTSQHDLATGKTLTTDLHGLTVERALTQLADALQEAVRTKADQLIVVHGLGTGRVKEATHRFLATIPTVKSFKLSVSNPGSTVVFL